MAGCGKSGVFLKMGRGVRVEEEVQKCLRILHVEEFLRVIYVKDSFGNLLLYQTVYRLDHLRPHRLRVAVAGVDVVGFVAGVDVVVDVVVGFVGVGVGVCGVFGFVINGGVGIVVVVGGVVDLSVVIVDRDVAFIVAHVDSILKGWPFHPFEL